MCGYVSVCYSNLFINQVSLNSQNPDGQKLLIFIKKHVTLLFLPAQHILRNVGMLHLPSPKIFSLAYKL